MVGFAPVTGPSSEGKDTVSSATAGLDATSSAPSIAIKGQSVVARAGGARKNRHPENILPKAEMAVMNGLSEPDAERGARNRRSKAARARRETGFELKQLIYLNIAF
jgi:hypothetical protein